MLEWLFVFGRAKAKQSGVAKAPHSFELRFLNEFASARGLVYENISS